MTGQQAIPVPPAPRRGPCAWCGTPTSLTITLEQNWTSRGGVRVPKSTKWAWVCPAHDKSLGRRGE
jgi:hypothetical protein